MAPPNRVACAHVDTTKEALVYEVRARHGFNPTSANGVPAVIHSRRSVLVSRATEADLRTAAQNAEQLSLFQQLGPKSWIIVPLIAHERVLGTVTFAITESTRRYGRADLLFAEVIASHTAAAIENARLYRDAEAARSAAESAQRAKDEFLSDHYREPDRARRLTAWSRASREPRVARHPRSDKIGFLGVFPHTRSPRA